MNHSLQVEQKSQYLDTGATKTEFPFEDFHQLVGASKF
jgi:hypothetical protein